MVEPVQSSTMARHFGNLHHGLSYRKGACPRTSFQCSFLDVGGASEVDETEHSEVQLALLLHVHEDRQLQSEEEVSRSPGIFFPPANKAPITIYFILICSTSSMLA